MDSTYYIILGFVIMSSMVWVFFQKRNTKNKKDK